MKVLFSSHLPLKLGGYSNQLHELIKKLVFSSIEVGIICWHCEDIQENQKAMDLNFFKENYKIFNQLMENDPNKYKNIYDKVKFYLPGKLENFWKKIEFYSIDFKPDKIIFYQDIHMVEYYNIGKINAELYLWLNVHNDFNYTQGEEKIFSFLPLFKRIITCSNFGVEVFKKYNYNATLIRHTINKEIFRNKNNKKQIRKKYEIDEDMFVCLMIAKNSGNLDRKAFVYNLEAFRNFSRYNKCKIIIKSGIYDKEYISKLIKKLKLEKHVIPLISDYLNTDQLADLYNIADVLLAASTSEGFGIPSVESQFCGTPVITTNCTAMVDNTFNGIKTEPKEISVTVNGINGWSNPSVENIEEALKQIKSKSYKKKEINRKNYDMCVLFKEWKSILDI